MVKKRVKSKGINSSLVMLVILLILAILVSVSFYKNSTNKNSTTSKQILTGNYLTGKVTVDLPIPGSDCSNESIWALWDKVFTTPAYTWGNATNYTYFWNATTTTCTYSAGCASIPGKNCSLPLVAVKTCQNKSSADSVWKEMKSVLTDKIMLCTQDSDCSSSKTGDKMTGGAIQNTPGDPPVPATEERRCSANLTSVKICYKNTTIEIKIPYKISLINISRDADAPAMCRWVVAKEIVNLGPNGGQIKMLKFINDPARFSPGLQLHAFSGTFNATTAAMLNGLSLGQFLLSDMSANNLSLVMGSTTRTPALATWLDASFSYDNKFDIFTDWVDWSTKDVCSGIMGWVKGAGVLFDWDYLCYTGDRFHIKDSAHPDGWVELQKETIYYFDKQEPIVGVGNHEMKGEVSKDHNFNAVTYLKSSCDPVWVEHPGACQEGDFKTTYYTDSKACGFSKDNVTADCDYDGNGFIGTQDDIYSRGVDVVLTIDGYEYDDAEEYSGVGELSLVDDDDNELVAFEWDFSSPLNLRNIEIEKQSSSHGSGYIIVNGIDADKAVIVDKKKTDTTSICILDNEVSSMSDFSDDCENSDETLIECPGEEDDYSCELSDDEKQFIVTGLTHSAVEEYVPAGTGGCTPDWSCGSWGPCVNGQQVHTCMDLEDCANPKTETQACSSGTPTCISDWDYGEWSDCVDGVKTRTATDSKGCEADKEETKDCSATKKPTWIIWVIVGVLAVLVIAVIIAIIFATKKNSYSPQALRRY